MASGDSQNEFGHLFGKTPKELFSEIFYQKRETDVSQLNKYKEHCDSIIFLPQKIGYMKHICKKILKYLEHSEQWVENKSVYDECILLNYWVYDTLDKYFNHNTDDTKKAFGTLQLKWSYLIDDSSKTAFYKKCKPLFKEILDYHDWKQRKELYDYYVDFDTLFGTAKNIPAKCEEYYKIIEGKKSLYNHFENECLSNENNCPELYNRFPNYNPNKVLSSLPCHEKIEAQKTAAAEASHRALTSQQHHGKGIQPGSNIPGAGLTQENSEIGTKVGHSVLGVAPVLLTATALYRYTPIGSWIRNLGGNNPNNMGNIDGEMEGFLGSIPESGNMFFEGGGNYISYQPM